MVEQMVLVQFLSLRQTMEQFTDSHYKFTIYNSQIDHSDKVMKLFACLVFVLFLTVISDAEEGIQPNFSGKILVFLIPPIIEGATGGSEVSLFKYLGLNNITQD